MKKRLLVLEPSRMLLRCVIIATTLLSLTLISPVVAAGASLPTPLWVEHSLKIQPSPRDAAMTTYDPVTGDVLLFGGESLYEAPTRRGYLDDTWVWNGNNWHAETPATKPPPRQAGAMAYDAATNDVILFGGFVHTGASNSYLNDTWVWNGKDWIAQSPTTSPSPRCCEMAMAYDPMTASVVLFGGTAVGPEPYNCFESGCPVSELSDTWVWDGSNWTEKSPMESPPSAGLMIYDPALSEVIMLVGTNAWGWNGSNWNKISGDSVPAGCGQSWYDPTLSELMAICQGGLFGWNGKTWVVYPSVGFSPSGAALERNAAQVVYDTMLGSALGVGSLISGPSDSSFETWTLNYPALGIRISPSLRTLQLRAAKLTVPLGARVSETATLAGPQLRTAAGAVTYRIYSNRFCTDEVAYGGRFRVRHGLVTDSKVIRLTSPGTYYWQITYAPASRNEGIRTPCEAATETVK